MLSLALIAAGQLAWLGYLLLQSMFPMALLVLIAFIFTWALSYRQASVIKIGQRANDRQKYDKAHSSVSLFKEGIHAGNMGNWKESIIKFKMAIREDPYNSEAYYYLTSAYIELGNWYNAKKEAEIGLENISFNDIWRGRLLYVLGDALIMLKEDAKAINILEQSLQYKDRDSELNTNKIQEKLKLLRANQGNEIRKATYKDPRYKNL